MNGATASATVGLLALVLFAGCALPDEADPELGPDDVEALRATEAAYVPGWESNDSAAVMSTATRDAVLLPDRTAPIRGDSAIRAHWWPDDGSETRITSYRTEIEEVGGSCDLAHLRGRGSLEFEGRASADDDWQSYSSTSVWLAVLRRGPDGAWRMTHRMWHRVGGG